MMTIILVSILGAIISAVVGTFWYSNATPMGKVHMAYLGFDKLSKEEQQKKMKEAAPKMWKSYLLQMILSAITSLFIVTVLKQTVQYGVSANMIYGYIVMIWGAFVIPLTGSALLWSNCDRKLVWKKFFSDIFCNLLTYILIAFVASFFV